MSRRSILQIMSTAGPHHETRAGANAIAHALRAWWCARLGRPLRG
ncbi:hypothetical protein BOO71_0013141 [Deinococcus marmoris]|uniref:Uncharacterized protein n=1 Tax=Deinococcus marmoris TaxID=249408 RepID=A0A1U7NT11_9DEIO|nr:hypothetical protein BOO71_0013141 [Deinococcus marmoris]